MAVIYIKTEWFNWSDWKTLACPIDDTGSLTQCLQEDMKQWLTEHGIDIKIENRTNGYKKDTDNELFIFNISALTHNVYYIEGNKDLMMLFKLTFE